MKLRTIFTAAALTALFAAAPVVAHATTTMATGTSIMNGTTRTGGMTTIRAGSGIIIRNGSQAYPEWRTYDGD